MSVDFLTVQDVLRIHEQVIHDHGGDPRIRDEGLLLSALAVPQAAFFGQYAHADAHEMAAAYLFHIVMNHPFVDGNKRTGAVAAVLFLEMNNVCFIAPRNALAEFTFELAKGNKTKAQAVEFFKQHTA